jgi:DNA (cytosine-5)-methyltransferase 1
MRHLDLFTGIAGFSLAAREVWGDEHTIISFCEIDRRCREFLARAWPGIPCHDDIKTLDATQWLGAVDLCCAGIPCQPASRAGKQKGSGDERWLWPEALRIIEECKPTWLLLENPPGIQDVGLDGILAALEGQGYEIGILDIPACAVGSPQLRHRLWILGFSMSIGSARNNGRRSREESEDRCEGNLAHSGMSGCEISTSQPGDAGQEQQAIERGVLRGNSPSQWGSSIWLSCADGKVRRAPDDSICLVDGLHRSILGALGNSIVPQVAVEIMRAIKTAMEQY